MSWDTPQTDPIKGARGQQPPLKGESSKVTTDTHNQFEQSGMCLNPDHITNCAGGYRDCALINDLEFEIRQIVDVILPRVGEVEGMTEQLRDAALDTAERKLVALLGRPTKPTQANKTFALVMDIIWTWLIKNGVEVSEEAKDELAKQVKQVIGG